MSPILIVDDDAEILDTVKMVLELEGHRCIQAKSGSEAFELIAKRKPNLVILDHVMPDMSGLEVYKTLRNSSNRTPVILLSADIEICYKAWASTDDRTLVMKKPFDIEELLKAVARLTQASAA